MNNSNVNVRNLPFAERPEHLEIIKQHTVDFFGAGISICLKWYKIFSLIRKISILVNNLIVSIRLKKTKTKRTD